MKSPFGNFHCLMLSGEAEANVYLQDVMFYKYIHVFLYFGLN